MVNAVTSIALTASGAAGAALHRAPHDASWRGSGAHAVIWGAGVTAASGCVVHLARQDRGRAARIAVAAVLASGVPAGLVAATRATRRTIRVARHHGNVEQRSSIEADLLHTRVEGALLSGSAEAMTPELQRLLAVVKAARDEIGPAEDEATAKRLISWLWHQMAMSVETYDNVLDRARTWHTREIELLTLVLTYELRLLLAVAPVLLPQLVPGVDPLDGPAWVTAVWATYAAVASGTAVLAPWVASQAMDTTRSRFRGRLAAVEIASGSAVLVAVPTWATGAGVLSAVLNIWNREGGFEWRSKVPFAAFATIGGLTFGLARARRGRREVGITLGVGTVAVLVTSNSYGVWWWCSGTSLIGSRLAERVGVAQARARAAQPLARVDAELAEAERRLEARAERDALFRVRLARRRLAHGLAEPADNLGEVLLGAVGESEPTLIRVDASDLLGLELAREDDRRRLREAVVLLLTEALQHGEGEVDLHVARSSLGVEVHVENAIGPERPPAPRSRPARGRERLRELAEGLEGAAFDPHAEAGRYRAGFWFPA